MTTNDPSLHQVGDVVDRRCPKCSATVPHQLGYVPWCECGWNIADLPAPESMMGRVWKRFNDSSGRSLLNEVKRHGDRPPRFNLQRLLAIVLALAIIIATFALPAFLLGVAVLLWPHWTLVFPLVPAVAILWWFRPRWNEKLPETADPKEFPVLYWAVNDLARTMGTAPVDGIVFVPGMNAAVAEVGWRRKRVMFWGLAFYALRTPQEWVAVLGHELGHYVNGDPMRGRIVDTGLDTLYRWYEIVRPTGWDDYLDSSIGCLGIFPLIARRVVSLITSGLIFLFGLLVWRDSQRAEYHADALSAVLAGRAVALVELEKMLWISVVNYAISLIREGMSDDNVFLEMRRQAGLIPERELERIRRNQVRPDSSIDASHPPTVYRIEAVAALPDQPPQYVLSDADAAAIEAELLPAYRQYHDAVVQQERFRIGQVYLD